MPETIPDPIPNEADDEVLELEMVEQTFQTKGGGNRNTAGGTLTRTGYWKSNAEGSEQLDTLASKKGLRPGEYSVTFGVDSKRKVIAAKVVAIGTANAMPVRRTDEKALAFHLGAVFLKHPELRPVTVSECPVAIRKDSKGEPCLMIALQSAQAKSKSRTTKSGAGSQPATEGT